MTASVPLGVAEQTEIVTYVSFAAGAPQPVRDAMGIASGSFGAGLALTVGQEPSCFFNRAGGFSSSSDVTLETLREVRDFYREQGVRQGSMMIAPAILPQDWGSITGALNLKEGSRFTKLGCAVETALPANDGVAKLDPRLRVGQVEPHQAREWASVMMNTFGFAPGMVDVAASLVHRPDWRNYAVWENERIVAAGSVFLNGDSADMFGGATVPEARGRGAQSALLTARTRAAEAAGCRWLVAEAVAEGPTDHNTSLHNMLRAGFEPLYDRVTWSWRP
ncbi:GNAT family N-acetyltransferase [Streptomyces tendae]|uniref:GNAT family N-acetyltransferase n=1 Tax=Streptomyces tendae TaxID=1932 RepID=UPI003D719615